MTFVNSEFDNELDENFFDEERSVVNSDDSYTDNRISDFNYLFTYGIRMIILT